MYVRLLLYDVLCRMVSLILFNVYDGKTGTIKIESPKNYNDITYSEVGITHASMVVLSIVYNYYL